MTNNKQEYYKKHRREIIERFNEWRENNKEKFLAYQRGWQKKNRKKNPLGYLLHNIKQRCEYKKDKKYKYYGGKGINCLLTIKDLEYLWQRDKAWLLRHPSIDRMNSDDDYCIPNCQFIEMEENRKKRQKTVDKLQNSAKVGIVKSNQANRR